MSFSPSLRLIAKYVTVVYICFIPAAFSLEISRPTPSQAPLFEPDEIVVFGDSLSDSNGDSYGHAYSTFNLLRTLKGQMDLVGGQEKRPMDLSELIGKRATLGNLRYRFNLNKDEMLRDSEEQGFWWRVLGKIEAHLYLKIGELLISIFEKIDQTEHFIDKAILSLLNTTYDLISEVHRSVDKGSNADLLLTSLQNQVRFLKKIVDEDLEQYILDFGEEELIEITSHLGNTIPLIPDSAYYVRGRLCSIFRLKTAQAYNLIGQSVNI